MKKIFISILIVVMLITLCACKVNQKPSNQSQTESSLNNTSYQDLKCRSIPTDKWQNIKLLNTDTKMCVKFQIPIDWSLEKANANTFKILRNGKKIGAISTKDFAEPKESYQVNSQIKQNTEITMQIDLCSETFKDAYYHYFEITSTQKKETFSFKMQINYTELDEDAANNITNSVTYLHKINPLIPLSKTNDSKQILIIGNSLVATSQIDQFLEDMLTSIQSEYYTNAISIGMATVSTFVNDPAICDSISQGDYCYVFMCGFYSADAIEKLNVIKDACKASKTQLVIFPAHNENREIIESAVYEHDDTQFLDWKGEIDAIIDTGVDYFDFCINDNHKHSKPLAGYVGAHMIFKSLFGTPVPALSDFAPLSNEFVNAKLGDYVKSGGEIIGYSDEFYEIK